MCTFDKPASDAKSAAMLCAPLRDLRFDPALSQRATMWFRVVTAVALHSLRFLLRPAASAADRRDRVDEGNELSDVVDVRGSQDRREGNPLAISDDMMLRARLAPIGGIRARFFPPCTARIDELSTMARDQSILSAALSLARRTSCSFCQTPDFCHFRRYLQQLIPEPHPSSCGNISHGMPDLSTKRMPVRALRGSMGLRPGKRKRLRFAGGIRGSMMLHSSSSTSGSATCDSSSLLFRSVTRLYRPASGNTLGHFVRRS